MPNVPLVRSGATGRYLRRIRRAGFLSRRRDPNAYPAPGTPRPSPQRPIAMQFRRGRGACREGEAYLRRLYPRKSRPDTPVRVFSAVSRANVAGPAHFPTGAAPPTPGSAQMRVLWVSFKKMLPIINVIPATIIG